MLRCFVVSRRLPRKTVPAAPRNVAIQFLPDRTGLVFPTARPSVNPALFANKYVVSLADKLAARACGPEEQVCTINTLLN